MPSDQNPRLDNNLIYLDFVLKYRLRYFSSTVVYYYIISYTVYYTCYIST